MSESRQTYRFGPVERHGFLGPIRPSQAAVVIAGLLVGLGLLGSDPTISHAVGATAILAVSLGAVAVPVAGLTVERWVSVAAGWTIRRATGAHRYTATAPTAGRRLLAAPDASPDEWRLPPALRGVDIVQIPYRGRQVGAASERGGRLLTAVLACRVVSFSLLDAAAQERSLSHWGAVLAGCADTPVHRVQWLERTVPEEGNQLASWLAAERDRRIPLRDPIVESYLELIERSAQVSQEHQVLVAVQVDSARVRGHRRRDEATSTALVEETERVADGLRRAGVRVQGALTARHLGRLFRTGFDPYVAPGRNTGADDEEDDRPPDAGAVWPTAALEGWDHYRTDGAVHCTYWISGWPRVDVSALFLDPLLAQSGAVRTVAVTFEPASPDHSIREVEAQVTRDEADRALRARFGQAETARDQQAYTATRRRESELAAGYNEVRFGGFLTVTAPNLEHLQVAVADVSRDAARARIELRAMYGQQPESFTFTLPLCRGFK